MAIEVSDAVDNQDYQRTAKSITFSQKYYVIGAGSVTAAANASGIPSIDSLYVDIDLTDPLVPVPTVTNVPCVKVSCTNIEEKDDLHEITANYELIYNDPTGGSGSAPENPVNGDEFWIMESTNEVAHVNNSPVPGLTTSSYPDTTGQPTLPDPPEMNGLIGVTTDGDVEGVDILDEYYTLRVTLYKTASAVTDTYVNAINNVRGSVNLVPFYSAPASASLYKSFRISDYNSELKIIEFEFLVGKNKAQSDLAGFKAKDGTQILITGGKTAHQYIWNQGSEAIVDDATTSFTTGVYVESFYPPVNLATFLGLSGNLINP